MSDSPAAGGKDLSEAPNGATSLAAASATSNQTDRKLVVTSSLDVQVEDLREAYARAGQITRTLGGFVAESNISEGDKDRTATLRLRVPAARHDDLLTALRDLGGKVLKESTNVQEVTEEYTDLRSRLLNLQRNEAQYQELLRQTASVDQILNVSARLDSVRGDIERTQGRINLLDSLADFATVNLKVSAPGAARALPGPFKVFSEAWDVSLDVALTAADLGAVLVVAAIWLVPPVLLGYVAWRLFGRHLATAVNHITRWGERRALPVQPTGSPREEPPA